MNPSILLFEWMTGGGRWVDRANPDPDCPFESQGRSMILAAAADFAAEGCRVTLLWDARLDAPPEAREEGWNMVPVSGAEELWRDLQVEASRAGRVLFVAPESEGCLAEVGRHLSSEAARWLTPDLAFIELTSDKSATCEAVAGLGLETPAGFTLPVEAGPEELRKMATHRGLAGPVIVKPVGGAGREGQTRFDDESWCSMFAGRAGWRVETWCEGLPVSVTAVANRGGVRLAPPVGQQFDGPGGPWVAAIPELPGDLGERALRLAEKLVNGLRPRQGCFGMDLVLGADGRDSVIEINPRLTASYAALRAHHGVSLARWMLA